MIGCHLQEGVVQHRDRMALLHGDTCVSYGTIGRLVDALVETWGEFSGKRIGVCITSPLAFIGAVVALDLLGVHAFLVGRRSDEELERLKTAFRWHGLIRQEDVPELPIARKKCHGASYENAGLVTLLTSGTTGTPKAANHSWTSLASPVRKDKQYLGTRWFLAYPLHLYAGTQVFLQAFLNWATLVIPTSLQPGEITRTLRDARVTHATGTPTLWRQLLLFTSRENLQTCTLQQITLGGEPVTQGLLDDLRRTFPRARIAHIYASTELGRMFSVTDGKAGFPVKFLQEPPEASVALRIVDGELMAHSRNAMIAYDGQPPLCNKDDEWFATGDVVEIQRDRVIFKGRSSDIINVGGNKVFPAQVEAALGAVPGIVHIKVYAKKSSLVGQLVAADIVLAPDVDESATRAALQRIARERLQPHEVPRILRVVPDLAMNEALKIVRQKAQI